MTHGIPAKHGLPRTLKGKTIEVGAIVTILSGVLIAYSEYKSGDKPENPPAVKECNCDKPATTFTEKGGDPVCQCEGHISAILKKLESIEQRHVNAHWDTLKRAESVVRDAKPKAKNSYTGMVMYVDDVDALLNGTSTCPPCRLFVEHARQRGFTVGNSPSDDFNVAKIDNPSSGYPQFTVFVNGKSTVTKLGYRGDFDSIAKMLPHKQGTF